MKLFFFSTNRTHIRRSFLFFWSGLGHLLLFLRVHTGQSQKEKTEANTYNTLRGWKLLIKFSGLAQVSGIQAAWETREVSGGQHTVVSPAADAILIIKATSFTTCLSGLHYRSFVPVPSPTIMSLPPHFPFHCFLITTTKFPVFIFSVPSVWLCLFVFLGDGGEGHLFC